MQLFYSSRIEGDRIFLNEEETRHATSVLRKVAGDLLQVIDGKGNLFGARIVKATKRETELEILETKKFSEPEKEIHLVVAPTKNMDRMEWLLEKSIEIGLSSLSFIRCEHSERKQVNMERLEKIALAACKQSLTWHFPELHDMVPFTDYIQRMHPDQGFIAVCKDAEVILNKQTELKERVHLMIGPEGDFSDNEYALARAAGWTGLSFGNKRLRTETAALLGVTNINFL
ncbi:MAG: RsmE family RNA methyltransferase [Bacteroidia bacterium]